MKTHRGAFTLVEVIMAMAVFTFMLGAIYTALLMSQHAWTNYAANVAPKQEIRRALTSMSNDLREAEHVFIVKEPGAVELTFDRPTVGRVVYRWQSAGADARKIVRSNYTKTAVIASNISQLDFFSPIDNQVIIDVWGGGQDFYLRKKIALRPKTGLFAQSANEKI
jgi:prepilin-type N-terminal cleavage/methylation domain-containing protein